MSKSFGQVNFEHTNSGALMVPHGSFADWRVWGCHNPLYVGQFVCGNVARHSHVVCPSPVFHWPDIHWSMLFACFFE